jgi:transcriptional regulator with XRE-family HTH domain
LIALRERLELSQVAFADALHIAKNTLNGYERGTRSLTIETAGRIRKRYGISTDWLLYGDVGQPSQDLVVKLGPAPQTIAGKEKAKAGKPGKKRRKAA